MNSIRDSGIKGIGNIRWGTHIANLFMNKEEILEVSIPFILAGLENNELCLWIYTQNANDEDVKYALADYLEDVDSFIESGQLILMSYREWYLKDNCFNEIRVNEQWKMYVDKALDQGFEGLRTVADASWLEKSYFRTFQSYEKKVDEIISELPFLAICLYDARKLNVHEIAGITKNHTYVIARYENNMEIIKNVELLIKDKQLEESEERYKKLLEFLPISVCIHDDKKIFYCNQPYSIIGIVKNICDFDGKSILDYVPVKRRDRFRRYINNILNGNKEIDYIEGRFIYTCEQIKNVEIISMRYSYYGKPALLSVIRDTSPFKKINRLELDIKRKDELLDYTLELDKMKTEFFSNISHELRTPINIILGIIQLMELQENSDNASKEEKHYIRIMKQNCFRLIRLVNNIIDLTKIESDYYQINKLNCNIVSLVENITMSVVDYAKSKDISVTFDTNVEEKIIACDPDQMDRIILNLLSNAIKFTQSGGKILVSIYDYGDHISISVKDNGVGIPRHKLENIFNRFEQADKSLTRKNEGSGIGLSIVKALVEKHNGSITVNSELGKGSEFIIYIPCEKVEEQPSLKEQYNLSLGNYQDREEKIYLELSDIYIN